MKKDADLLIVDAAQLVTMDPKLAAADPGDVEAAELGVIPEGAVAITNGRIAAVGPTERIRDEYEAARTIDASRCIVAPGLIDCHTHAVFAGSRHQEFAMRMRGATYQDILAAGGGIHATVRATRAATSDNLVALARGRLARSLNFGVTTMEIKSGYGLDVDTELKILLAVQRLGELQPVQLVPTYLGAHVVPLEFRDRRSEYVDLMIEIVIPEVARQGLAVGCDVFIDEGAFTVEEAAVILGAASRLGLRPKAHAGQFTDRGGPELVAHLGGLSADHLEAVSDEGIAAMAAADVVAVLLPGAAFSLRDRFPDGRRLVDSGVAVAVATDDNPGTSRTENLPLMAAMAATRMGLTVGEAWKAITVNAARALGLAGEAGKVVPGLRADVAVFSVPDFRAFLYHFGVSHTAVVIAGGRIAFEVKSA